MNCNSFEIGKEVKFRYRKGVIRCKVLWQNNRQVKVEVLGFDNFAGYSQRHWKGKTKTLPKWNKFWDTADGVRHKETFILGGVPVFVHTGDRYGEFEKRHIPKKKKGFQLDPSLSLHIANAINYRHITGGIKPTILDGPPGTGKTESIRQVFHALNRPLIEIPCNGGTSISQLVGRRDISKGDTKFTYGVLPYAMKKGIGVLLDEFDAAEGSVNIILHSVAQDGLLHIPELNETIKAHKDFVIFATGNTFTCPEDELDLFDRNEQDDATKRRFYIYRTNPLSDSLLINAIFKGTELSLNKSKIIVEIFKQINEHKKLNVYVTAREALKWAREFPFYDNKPLKASEGCIINLFREPEERKIVCGIIEKGFK